MGADVTMNENDKQAEPVACLVGMKGGAFDTPTTKRAYTYAHQPNNGPASRLGDACLKAMTGTAGDSIDRGLLLLKALQDAGFGVFDLGAEYTRPEDHSGLIKRIDAAIERVTQGRGLMSIPADPRSDVDLVLSECKALLQGENPPFWAIEFHPPQPVQPALQGEPHIDRFKSAWIEWSYKTEWVQEKKDWPFNALGMHRADVMKKYIDHLEAQIQAQPVQPAACQYCDGAGDVHGIDGEWRGECTECKPASQGEPMIGKEFGLPEPSFVPITPPIRLPETSKPNPMSGPDLFIYEFDHAVFGTHRSLSCHSWNGMIPSRSVPFWRERLYTESPAAAINEETKQEILRLTNLLIDQLHRAGPAIGTNLVNVYCGRILAHLTARMADFQNFNRQVIDPVLNELEKATTKFPIWPTDPLHALAVLGEEFGELTQAVLQCTYEPHKSNGDDVRTEATQTAAMALRFLASLGEYEYKPGEQHSQAEGAKGGE